jgi:hypothetical protein
MTVFAEKYGMMPEALRAAAKDRALVNVLIDFLSGTKTYREIVSDTGITKLSVKFLKGLTIST